MNEDLLLPTSSPSTQASGALDPVAGVADDAAAPPREIRPVGSESLAVDVAPTATVDGLGAVNVGPSVLLAPPDALDRQRRTILATVGALLLVHGIKRPSLAGLVTAGVGAVLLERNTLYAQAGAPLSAPEAEATIVVNAPPGEAFRMWREPANLQQFMAHFAAIGPVQTDYAFWTLRFPAGSRSNRGARIGLKWDAITVEDRPGELYRFASSPGAGLPNEGEVLFRAVDGGMATEMTLRVRFVPPGGFIGDKIARARPELANALMAEALRRFKSLAETGQLPDAPTSA